MTPNREKSSASSRIDEEKLFRLDQQEEGGHASTIWGAGPTTPIYTGFNDEDTSITYSSDHPHARTIRGPWSLLVVMITLLSLLNLANRYLLQEMNSLSKMKQGHLHSRIPVQLPDDDVRAPVDDLKLEDRIYI